MLEVAFLASHLLNACSLRHTELLFDMATAQAARVLRLADYGLEVARAAHLVVLDGTSVYGAILRHRPPRYVISHGRLVARSREDAELFPIGTV